MQKCIFEIHHFRYAGTISLLSLPLSASPPPLPDPALRATTPALDILPILVPVAIIVFMPTSGLLKWNLRNRSDRMRFDPSLWMGFDESPNAGSERPRRAEEVLL
ncbi:hypothetical protein HK57_00161 [Aspergillus ustus]|uniref:Uncharacterized protein n=1 Tax=Aspergillus ustus TaxID=40382 RepID=A0A0C1EH59_ASPUT|nr:hypothetical protein HK57_00161 [Aspergillus ustus]